TRAVPVHPGNNVRPRLCLRKLSNVGNSQTRELFDHQSCHRSFISGRIWTWSCDETTGEVQQLALMRVQKCEAAMSRFFVCAFFGDWAQWPAFDRASILASR